MNLTESDIKALALHRFQKTKYYSRSIWAGFILLLISTIVCVLFMQLEIEWAVKISGIFILVGAAAIMAPHLLFRKVYKRIEAELMQEWRNNVDCIPSKVLNNSFRLQRATEIWRQKEDSNG